MDLVFWIVNRELMDALLLALADHPYTGGLLCLWVFYIGFVVYAGLQPAIKARRWGVVIPCLPILLPAGAIDVLLSPVVGMLVFHEFKHHWTISKRLDAHYYSNDWRGERAQLAGKWVNWILPAHIGG